MTRLERRRRSQRGSILSALLIIIAFLSIIGSALMSEISSQFLMTRSLVDQVTAQATDQSALESAITALKTRGVPPQCSTDQPKPMGPIALNNEWGATNQIVCRGIVPDVAHGLAAGGFMVDGTHVGAHRTYLVGDQNGNVFSYQFGQNAQLLWERSVGHAVTAPPDEMAFGGHFLAAIPNGNSMTFVNDFGSSASTGCSVSTSSVVRARPGFGAGTAFPTYTFFGDDSGRLYVSDPTCQAPAPPSTQLGGRVVGSVLVLPGTVTTNQRNGACPGGEFGEGQDRVTTTTADVIVLISSSSSSALVDVTYTEDKAGSITETCWITHPRTLSSVNATGISYYASGNTTLAAVGFAGGQLQLATITASSAEGRSSGFTYALSRGQSVQLGGSVMDAPRWSADGSDVGVSAGSTLFVFDRGLRQLYRYDNQAPITSSPAADIHGDWYFGANDGYVYDVEPVGPGTPSTQACNAGSLKNGNNLWCAARFGLGGQIQSSPIVGSASDGCAGNVCMYFGDASKGSYFVQIGNIRVMELRSCITSGTSSTSCVTASANNPSLWARLEVGDPTYMQGRSVNVIGWAYSNGP